MTQETKTMGTDQEGAIEQEGSGSKGVEVAESHHYFTELKRQIWEAIGDGDKTLPDFGNLMDRPFTLLELRYLMERFATFTIWNVFDLEPAGEKKLMALSGQSPHYLVYDRGSHLVCTPKDLFSHERTRADALQTARAMVNEAYQRDWTIELFGFDAMMRAAWVEAQVLAHKNNKPIEILHYHPTATDHKLCQFQQGRGPFSMSAGAA